MLKRSRLLFVAIGGLIALIPAGQAFWSERQCENDVRALENEYAVQRAEQQTIENEYRSRNPVWSIPLAIESDAETELDADETKQREQRAAEQASYIRDRFDLCAQQAMAGWTRAIGVFTLIGLAVLYITFDATRAAVIETRRIGEAQFRCYPGIVEAWASLGNARSANKIFSDDPPQALWASGRIYPTIYFKGKNFGQSHAYAFSWRPAVAYRVAAQQATMRRSEIRPPKIEDGVPVPPGQEFSDSCVLDFPVTDGEFAAARSQLDRTPLEIYVLLKIRYTDVFGTAIEKDWAFYGVAHAADVGQKIPLAPIPLEPFMEGLESAVAIHGG